jgi:type II secretory ATPase GspE/PulE/Tfp pilus assembly ATPase PilB-like protein
MCAVEGFVYPTEVFFGVGCEACRGSGFLGRSIISEVLVVNDPIREAIMRREAARSIKNLAMKAGMRPLILDGFEKVREGTTTLEEVFRVVHEA